MSGTSGTTSVPTISFTDKGFVVPPQSDILTGLQADTNAAFGGNMNLSPTTPQGQLNASQAAIIGDCNDQLVALFNGVDPALASGRLQDAIARIYYLERLPAQPTVLEVICSGIAGVIIPANALIADSSGNLYFNTGQVIIQSSGSVTASFSCQTTGPTPVPASISIYQSIPQWNTVSVSTGVVGNVVESRSQFEIRRQQTVAANGAGFLPTILGAVLQVSGVLDAYVTENFTASPATLGGVSLLPNSMYVCVAGGAQADIAQAIWSKKNPGCNMTGNQSPIPLVYDSNSGYTAPFPSYPINFQTPTGAPIVFNVVVANSNAVPSNATALVQAAIQSGFTGQDEGARARIGSTLYASRYYSDVALLGSWASIIDIQIGCALVPNASFTASITGTALTITGGTTGTIAAGQFIHDANGLVAPGTMVVSGSGSSWVVSVNHNVASTAMTSVSATSNNISMQINWLPSLQPLDINLILQ
jgi:hypothetical protein